MLKKMHLLTTSLANLPFSVANNFGRIACVASNPTDSAAVIACGLSRILLP